MGNKKLHEITIVEKREDNFFFSPKNKQNYFKIWVITIESEMKWKMLT